MCQGGDACEDIGAGRIRAVLEADREGHNFGAHGIATVSDPIRWKVSLVFIGF